MKSCLGVFHIVGEGTVSNIFARADKPAQISVEELTQKAKFIRPAILGRIRNQDPLAVLRCITNSEASGKGWLRRPQGH